MRLGLGTVQFGMSYGISNQTGKVSANDVRAILALALHNGIDVLDTATDYGDSEATLGATLADDIHSYRVVTKAPSLQKRGITSNLPQALRQDLLQSLSAIQCHRVYGYLLHDPRDLLVPTAHKLVEALREIKQEGLVEKIGVSVYSAAEIDDILKIFVPDIIQVPISIFDQRLLASGHLAELKRRGVEIHARSIFLQGLLLMESGDAPDFCAPVVGHFQKFSGFIKDAGLTRLEAALAYIEQVEEIDVALVGVSSRQELEGIIGAVTRNAERRVKIPNASEWAIGDERIVNPALWPKRSAGQHA